jgi:hypothetical protein
MAVAVAGMGVGTAGVGAGPQAVIIRRMPVIKTDLFINIFLSMGVNKYGIIVRAAAFMEATYLLTKLSWVYGGFTHFSHICPCGGIAFSLIPAYNTVREVLNVRHRY